MAILLAFMLVCTGCTDRKEQQSVFRQEGIALMEEGSYQDALKKFQKALDLALGEVGETEMDICFYKAEALYHLGEIEEAMDTYSSIIDFNQNPKAYFLRGNLYYSQNENENALKDYAAAVEQEKKDYDLYIGIYEALSVHKEEQKAQEYLNLALEIKGDKAYDKMQKGYINFLLGETQTAVSLLEEAVQEKETKAYLYLAEAYEQLGDSQKAEETIAAYIQTGEADSYGLYGIANMQMKNEAYALAIETLNHALTLDEIPNKQVLMKTLAIAYEQNQDLLSAKNIMETYVEEYPDDTQAQREYMFLKTR